MSDSVRPHRRQPIRLPCPWDSPGKNTGVGGHSLLQGIFPTQAPNLSLLHWRQILDPASHQESVHLVSGLFGLRRVFSAAGGPSSCTEQRRPSLPGCGLLPQRLLLVQSTASAAAALTLSCPAACGIFPDQGSNLRPLLWQADSLPSEPPGKPQY